jgi:LacI family transcriptional regulator
MVALKAMKKQLYKADITAVAKAAGVSAATVSRVMNHPDIVNPQTRRKVEAAIRRTGYIRNRAAQAMHGRRSATLGLVVPTVNYSIFAELVQSFNDTVSDLGFTLLLATHGYDLATEYQVLRKLLEHRVDGVALIGLDHSDDTYRLLSSQEVPAVAVWNYAEDSPISCIGSDNREAGRLAATHLLSLGHRRIGFIFPPTAENDRARGRLEAAKEVLAAQGVEVPDGWCAQSRYSTAEAKAVCRELLSRRHPLTALVCGNDTIAQGAVAAATEMGIAVPGALSIVGIGDFAGSADMVPALTTVRIPAWEIGARAGRHLVDRVADPGPDEVLRVRVEVTLNKRTTTSPVAAPG